MTKADQPADIAAFIDDAEGRWSNVPAWVIFEDEDGHGIVRTESGSIIAETMLSNGTHENAVRIVNACEDIRTLLAIARAQGEKIAAFEKNAREFQAWLASHDEYDVRRPLEEKHRETVGSLLDQAVVLEKERDDARGSLAKLEDACRNVLTTEPPPPNEVYSAWSGCAQMSEYQAWFHRQFNLTQVAELLEHSNGKHGQ